MTQAEYNNTLATFSSSLEFISVTYYPNGVALLSYDADNEVYYKKAEHLASALKELA